LRAKSQLSDCIGWYSEQRDVEMGGNFQLQQYRFLHHWFPAGLLTTTFGRVFISTLLPPPCPPWLPSRGRESHHTLSWQCHSNHVLAHQGPGEVGLDQSRSNNHRLKVDMNRLIYRFFGRKIWPPCFTNILLSECVESPFPFLAVVAYHNLKRLYLSAFGAYATQLFWIVEFTLKTEPKGSAPASRRPNPKSFNFVDDFSEFTCNYQTPVAFKYHLETRTSL
jgi:hypothetical protein